MKYAPVYQPVNLVDDYSTHIDVFFDNSHQHAADFRAHLAVAVTEFIDERTEEKLEFYI